MHLLGPQVTAFNTLLGGKAVVIVPGGAGAPIT